MVSLSDLPVDLTGSWLFQLRDHVNTHLATATIEAGRSVYPVTGFILRRFVIGMGSVVGAYRLEDGLSLGDVTGLAPVKTVEAKAEPAPEPEVKAVEKASQHNHQQGKRR